MAHILEQDLFLESLELYAIRAFLVLIQCHEFRVHLGLITDRVENAEAVSETNLRLNKQIVY